MRALVPIGRALFALVFVASAFDHFTGHAIARAAAHGVPLATVLVPLAGVIALLGGLGVGFGYHTRFAAFLLLVFLVPVTFVMHRFWGLADLQLAMLQKVMFVKNLSLMGGALLLVFHGGGPGSLDG